MARSGSQEIFVRQPQPTITVDIPQPEIVVRMPRPDVNVVMAQPQVQVQQNSAEPNVQVQQPNGQANVRCERAEPKMVVNQPQGQPNVRFEQPADGQQANAMQNQQRPQAPGQQPATTGAVSPTANALTVARVTDMDLYSEQNQQLGEVEHMFQSADGKQHIIIGRGGFLGLGERHVAVPTDRG